MKLSATKSPEEVPCFESDIVHTFLYDAADKIDKHGKDAINAFADGDEQRMLLLGLKRFTKANPFNSKEAKRRIADKLIALGNILYNPGVKFRLRMDLSPENSLAFLSVAPEEILDQLNWDIFIPRNHFKIAWLKKKMNLFIMCISGWQNRKCAAQNTTD